ncbi:Hypothetical predicted protein [Pelobates cultripes]|uniref:Uncharacterized protein n=1 Tax=Pelobates cultripes TaxID=61616 RepID=A0AAD1WBA1_PELCU|nr:Hypothetical predicted protein [Pelobates cultripes]
MTENFTQKETPEQLATMQKQKKTEKNVPVLQNREAGAARVSKGLQAYSPANKTVPRHISPQKSTLVGVVKTIPPTRPPSYPDPLLSERSRGPLALLSERRDRAASAATSEGGSVHSGRSTLSECRGQSPTSGLTEADRRSHAVIKAAGSLVYKSGRDTEEGIGGVRSRSPSRSSASRLGTPAGGLSLHLPKRQRIDS